MPWGKHDDKFHRSRKVKPLRRSLRGLAALGLRSLLHSECLDDPELDGRITADDLRTPQERQLCELLADAKLLDRDGEDYVIHDWADYNPTKSGISQAREKAAQRSAAYRERQRHGVTEPSLTHESSVPSRARASGMGTGSNSSSSEAVPISEALDLIASVTARTWDAQSWGDDLRWIAAQPERERRRVRETLAADPWVEGNPSKVTPGHVRKMWAKYSAPPDKGAPRPNGQEAHEQAQERARKRREAIDSARYLIDTSDNPRAVEAAKRRLAELEP